MIPPRGGTYEISGVNATITGYTGAGAVTVPSTLGGFLVTTIANYAFWNKTGLTSITLSNSITSIGDWAFSNCTGLTSINLPDGMTSEDTRFYGCRGLNNRMGDES